MGWSSAQPADNTPVTVATTMPATDLIYTAIWQVIPTYTVTVNTADKGTASLTADHYADAVGSGSYIPGTQVTISVTPYFGYTFTGWSDSNTQNPRTITVGSTAATYTAQFDAMDEIDITMTTGVLDFPTYAKNSFAIIGENEQVEVRLYFGAAISTGNHLANLSTDLANSYIQPAGENKRQIASATLATVTYYGNTFRAARLVAKVTDTDGRKYNIDIYTNYCINYATFEEDFRYTYYSSTLPTESSWVNGRSFEYGEDNYIGEMVIRPGNIMRYFLGQSGSEVYDWCQIQLQFYPDNTKTGTIPTGVYPINSTQAPGTVYIGAIPADRLTREDNSVNGYAGTGSWVFHDMQDMSTYVRTIDNWVLRGGYVEVVNVDENYFVHVHAYTDGYATKGEADNTVIDFTAGIGSVSAPVTATNITIAAQTTGGEALTDAVTATLSGASNWTDVSIGQGSHTFFSGNTLDMTAMKPGYMFDHWEVNGSPVAGEDFTYSYTVGASEANIVAVFAVDTRPHYTLTTETGGRGTVTLTAAGYLAQTGSGYYAENTDVTMSVAANTGSAFLRWSDGNTQNPRTVTVTGNITYTAEFSLESADAAVSVYQNVAASSTKILYNLDPRTGDDGLTYIPVDMGYGVAWADRNVGATGTNVIGSYFRWGDPVASNTFNSSIHIDASGFSTGDKLSNEQDAAYVNMGTCWHMPDKNELLALKGNTDLSNNNTFTNKTDNTKSIVFLAGGYKGQSHYDPDYQYYWSREYAMYGYNSKTKSNERTCFAFVRCTDNQYYAANLDKDDYYGNEYYLGMPVRAIYEPAYTTYTLTVNVGDKAYQYICQAGQNITVTAVPDEGYAFSKWTEDNNTNATRTFTVTEDMEYTATFVLGTQYYDVTVVSNNTDYGTVDVAAINDVESGTGITVSGSTLTIGSTPVTATKTTDDAQYTYTFSGWTDTEGNALPATVTGDLNIRANFTQTLNTYTVNFSGADANGSVTGKVKSTSASITTGDTQPYGTMLTFTATDIATGYEVDYWKNGSSQIAGSTGLTSIDYIVGTSNDIKAVFKLKHYTITWKDGDGNTLDTDDVEHGETPSYTGGTTPTKTAITGYTYTFNNTWTPEIVAATAAAEYTAQFNPVANTYALTLDKGMDGTANGSATATYDSNTLTSVTDATKTTGSWTLNGYFTETTGGVKVINDNGTLVANVDGYTDASGNWTRDDGATLYAQWTAGLYDFTFSAGANGSVSGTAADETKTPGTTYHLASGTSVSLTATANTFYEFVAWCNEGGEQVSTANPYNFSLDGNKDLTALFRIADVIELEDNHEVGDSWWTDYSNLVTALGDTKKKVRYMRDLPAGDKWCMFSLPFGYSFRSGNTLKGCVYELGSAEYTGEGQLTFYFAPVTTQIKPNHPYLYKSANGEEKPLFENVQLQAVEDGSCFVYNTNTTVGGTVTFHNTTARMLLAKSVRVIYIQNNRLYYPNLTKDTWMRAFRGYFKLSDDMPIYHANNIAPRVRIVVEGETATELEVVQDGVETATDVRKYIEKGILIIERNGVRYDATGARID
jgi:hypothetical protein